MMCLQSTWWKRNKENTRVFSVFAVFCAQYECNQALQDRVPQKHTTYRKYAEQWTFLPIWLFMLFRRSSHWDGWKMQLLCLGVLHRDRFFILNATCQHVLMLGKSQKGSRTLTDSVINIDITKSENLKNPLLVKMVLFLVRSGQSSIFPNYYNCVVSASFSMAFKKGMRPVHVPPMHCTCMTTAVVMH